MEKWEQFFGKGWTRELEEFLNSKVFDNIGTVLKDLRNKKTPISPNFNEIFRAFKECPWEKLHSIILSKAPYHSFITKDRPLADGLALSAKYAQTTPFLLDRVFNAIDYEVYNYDGFHVGESTDLTSLANQGILLLNTALTRTSGSDSEGHVALWRPFIQYVLRRINYQKDAIGVILMGDVPASYAPLLDNKTYAIYKCSCPDETRSEGKWDSNHVFSGLTAYQKMMNNIEILW